VAPELVSTLDELGKEHDIKLYPEAGHSYMNKDGAPALFRLASQPIYHLGANEEAAEDSWRRMLAFFEHHLVRDEAPA
jgi:carboxymethylenebutenolidase